MEISPVPTTTTFLQYVAALVCGEPIRGGQPGEWYFTCPMCDSDEFHTLPIRAGQKDRFKCWKCDFWGDEHDLLRHWPADGEPRPTIEELRREYESGEAPGISSRGRGQQADRARFEAAWEAMTLEEQGTLVEAAVIARCHRINLGGWDATCVEFGRLAVKAMVKHAATCKARECGCRPVRELFFEEYMKMIALAEGKARKERSDNVRR
jgi:hypothetical protein